MTTFADVALSPPVVAAMVAATSAGFGGLLGWFFNRLVARTERQAKNSAAQLEGWERLTETLQKRIQFLEEKDRSTDTMIAELRERILACEKERVSLTRENVRLVHNMRGRDG